MAMNKASTEIQQADLSAAQSMVLHIDDEPRMHETVAAALLDPALVYHKIGRAHV